MADFLPVSRRDMDARGWEQCDFVYVIGDAYVDHPTFGHAIISRILEAHGFKVGIIGFYISKIYQECQGRPRYLISETCGNAKTPDVR